MNECSYNTPGCDLDDWEFMCDQCREDNAEYYYELMRDTYD